MKAQPFTENVLGSKTPYNVQFQTANLARLLLREKLVGALAPSLDNIWHRKKAMVKLVISFHSKSLQRTQREELGGFLAREHRDECVEYKMCPWVVRHNSRCRFFAWFRSKRGAHTTAPCILQKDGKTRHFFAN